MIYLSSAGAAPIQPLSHYSFKVIDNIQLINDNVDSLILKTGFTAKAKHEVF